MEMGIPLFAPKLADTISGFDPKSFEMLAEIEDDHFWFVPRNRMLAGLIQKYFPNSQDILEVGCGNGIVLSALSKDGIRRRLVGSELHPSGLAVAAQRLGKNAELVQMDARDIMAENAFDVIGAYDVIEHIAEDEMVLHSMHKALRPGGGVVIAVPQHPWLWSTADEVAYHERRYKLGELEDKLNRNGFRPVFSTSYCSFLLPIMMTSRLVERWRKKNVQQSEMSDMEAKPPNVVNAILKSILQAEVSAILAGARFPVGGSRVVVATRV
ncbi:class I SAM-dependent methyltransferase [Agrobacterium tumefaciens]|nr:class I SAM-dependent methyltransferase [Agrobacterium tumefaciens]